MEAGVIAVHGIDLYRSCGSDIFSIGTLARSLLYVRFLVRHRKPSAAIATTVHSAV